MALHGLRKRRVARSPRRCDGRQDAAASRMQLLIARAAGAQRELVHPIPGKRGMRVAVDEPWHRAEASAVNLLDLDLGAKPKIAHTPDSLDPGSLAEHVRVLQHVKVAQVAAAQRSTTDRRRDELAKVADEQAPQAQPQLGRSSPCAAAAARASS